MADYKYSHKAVHFNKEQAAVLDRVCTEVQLELGMRVSNSMAITYVMSRWLKGKEGVKS